jgi:hypothetical protein
VLLEQCAAELRENPDGRTYRPGYRGWTKIKNPTYWRRESEVELVRRRRERAEASTA